MDINISEEVILYIEDAVAHDPHLHSPTILFPADTVSSMHLISRLFLDPDEEPVRRLVYYAHDPW